MLAGRLRRPHPEPRRSLLTALEETDRTALLVPIPRQHFSQPSITHKPSDGRRRRHVFFFEIGAPKAREVYPLAVIFRVTSRDRLQSKPIKPLEEGRVPHR